MAAREMHPALGNNRKEDSASKKKLDQFKDCAKGQTYAKRHSLPIRLISTALVAAFLAAATIMGCTGKNPKSDPDTNIDSDAPAEVEDGTELEDGHDAPDSEDAIDGSDVPVEPDAPLVCPEPGEGVSDVDDNPLKGEFTWTATFSGTDGSTTGPVTLEVGAEIGTGDDAGTIVWLGECDGEQVALGSQGPIPIEPQSKLSHNPNSDSSEGFPAAPEADFCPPLEASENNNPAEVNQGGGNATAKNLPVRAHTAPVELAFDTSLTPQLMVDGEEATSLVLDGSGFALKSVSIALPEFILGLAATVSNSAGEELLSAMLESEITAALAGGELSSAPAMILQVGSGESTIFDVLVDTAQLTSCLRCAPQEETKTVNVDISVPSVGECSAHGGLEITGLDVVITSVNPSVLEDDFSISSFSSSTLTPMASGPLEVTFTIQRALVSYADGGEAITIRVGISGRARHMATNPDSGINDTILFSEEVVNRDWDVTWEYGTNCGGCPPIGVF